MSIKRVLIVVFLGAYVVTYGCILFRPVHAKEEQSIDNVPGVILKFGSAMYFFADIKYDSKALDKCELLENAVVSCSKEAIILRYFENYSDAHFFCCADTIDLSQVLPDWDESYSKLLVCNARLTARYFEDSHSKDPFGVHQIIVNREPIIVRYLQKDYIIESIKCE